MRLIFQVVFLKSSMRPTLREGTAPGYLNHVLEIILFKKNNIILENYL